MNSGLLPRVLQGTVRLMRFAREAVGASAASLFLFDDESDTLRGLVSEWDWTRTSFASRLADWPTVARALTHGKPHTISKHDASGAETAWFEPRGIVSTVCVPLRAQAAPVGVLFFDFDTEINADEIDIPMLGNVGKRCAQALARRPFHVGSTLETPFLR